MGSAVCVFRNSFDSRTVQQIMKAVLNGTVLAESNAASCYPAPKEKAAEVKDHVAFYGVVTVAE